eukprot:GHVT01029546.1.p1 GENE.GHVT01029546.1~~GHVT01029546.1.p1  ORF type:complete len:114 (-),score=0.08 GHVT01029546.1:267-608(-)
MSGCEFYLFIHHCLVAASSLRCLQLQVEDLGPLHIPRDSLGEVVYLNEFVESDGIHASTVHGADASVPPHLMRFTVTKCTHQACGSYDWALFHDAGLDNLKDIVIYREQPLEL